MCALNKGSNTDLDSFLKSSHDEEGSLLRLYAIQINGTQGTMFTTTLKKAFLQNDFWTHQKLRAISQYFKSYHLQSSFETMDAITKIRQMETKVLGLSFA